MLTVLLSKVIEDAQVTMLESEFPSRRGASGGHLYHRRMAELDIRFATLK